MNVRTTQVAAPSDRRFRRAHVKPARKRGHRRAFVRPLAVLGVVLVAASYGMYRGRGALAQTRFLQVDRIVVHGNERLSKGEVLAVLSGLRGEGLFRTDLDLWRRRLMASPWVRDAALRRSLPSTVDVVISERQPIGIGRLKGDLYLVDERGVVIDQYGPEYADLDLPVIDGLVPAPADDASADDGGRAEMAARLIAATRAAPDIARKLSQIDVSDLHNVSVILSGDPAVIYLGDDEFLQRLRSYVELAPTLRERVPSIDYVDLRFDDRIYVRPVGKAAARAAVAPAVRVAKSRRR